jgi:hypothetical protein
MASSKRRRNKKLHQRRRKRGGTTRRNRANETAVEQGPLDSSPSELDQVGAYISEAELERPETSLSELRAMVRSLPFESAMLHVAVLLCRLGPRWNDPPRHRRLAGQLFGSRPELLAAYDQVLAGEPDRVIFSPQVLMFLMRLLLEHARDEPMRDLTSPETRLLQDAVLGAHSAMGVALDELELSSRDHVLAYELQAATFFRRAQPLEEMARQREFLRLATDDQRLIDSPDRVPVSEWLAEAGMSAEDQWTFGFGLAAASHAFDDPVTPHIPAAHIDELLTQIGLGQTAPELALVASSRSEFNAAFAELGGERTIAWEVRPFTTTPFLRFANGDLLLLSPPWLLSWLGEGFHYRALRHAQHIDSATSARYQRFAGQITELYALDLATAITPTVAVFGDQPYGPGGGDRTSDVAIVSGRDLVLFEVHARRVSATAAVTGSIADATIEVSRLLVEKVDQLGPSIGALLTGEATLPGIDIDSIDRIWPVVVSIGHVMQTRHLWNYIREAMNDEKAAPLRDTRVQPLQIMDISDYEKILALAETGETCRACSLTRRAVHSANATLPSGFIKLRGRPPTTRGFQSWKNGGRK